MFDIGWSEFVVIGVVALIVIGPKELPAVLRTIGQWTTKIRRMAGEFQSQFQEALREAEMADLKKEVDNITDTAKGFASNMTSNFDPLESTPWQPKPSEPGADKVEADKPETEKAETEKAEAAKADAERPTADIAQTGAMSEPPPSVPEVAVPEVAGAPETAPAHPVAPDPDGS